MEKKRTSGLVYTVRDLCRVCYTCVRECPVKAIKIVDGQAEVVQERCIACGNCTRVCKQGAKVYMRSADFVMQLMDKEEDVYALLAPSYVAEFGEIPDSRVLVGMLINLGFSRVYEVGMGADRVSRAYEALFLENPGKGYISSDCPAIVSYVEKYHPELIGSLAPVVSPMVTTARYIRKVQGEGPKLVFIGPCIAKKGESNEVDVVITFQELREILSDARIRPGRTRPADFTPPLAERGAGFPVNRGMLQSMDLPGKFAEQSVIVAEGRIHFQEAIREFASGALDSVHLQLLCCEGCIMGPGTSRDGSKFQRRKRVLDNLQRRLEEKEKQIGPEEEVLLDLSTQFAMDDQRLSEPSEEEITRVLHEMGKFSREDLMDCGACGYDTCRNHAIAIAQGLAEVDMCLPLSIERLHQSILKLADSNHKLVTVEQALRQSEKLAHMGQLSAGIAHELNNPLGVVIMYTNILLEEYGNDPQFREDLQLIVAQAERCKNIVGGLLNFARKTQVKYSRTDLAEMIRISISSIIMPDHIECRFVNQLTDPFGEVDSEQMIQVITNLLKNGMEAMKDGGILTINLSGNADWFIISIRDQGTGIEEKDMEKIFEPFYTTKGIGRGTGLGLATTYGIIKMHRGKIDVKSNTDPSRGPAGTEFTLKLPRTRNY